MLFISHNLSVVKKMADFIYVMKDGKVIESGTNEKIFSQPNHQYTKTLISAQSKKKINLGKSKKTILKVENLDVWYPIKKGLLKKTIDHVKAINNISFTLCEGESLGSRL